MEGGWGKGRHGGYVVGAVGVAILAVFLLCGSVLSDSESAYVCEQLLFSFVILCAAVLAGVAALRRQGQEGRVWLLIATACGSVFISQVYWTWAVAARGETPVPLSVSNVFDLIAMGIVVALVAMLVPAPQLRVSAWRLAVDAVGVLFVSVSLIYVYLIAPWYATLEGARVWGAVLGAVYPVLGIVILVGTVMRLLGPKMTLWSRWERLIGWAMMSLSAGLVLWPAHYATMLQGGGAVSTMVDLLWALGMFLIFGAAVYRLDSSAVWEVGPFRMGIGGEVPVSRFALPVVYGGTAMVLAYQAASSVPNAVPRDVLGALAAAAAMLFAVRGLLVGMEAREMVARAQTDTLTGVGDERAFSDALDGAISNARRYRTAVSVALIDLDRMLHFREVYGRDASENLLRGVADVARAVCGADGTVFRVGADRFALLLHGMHGEEAESIVNAVRIEHIEHNRDRAPSTISAGLACFPDDAETPEALTVRAETALWWAKANGRDRVVVHDETVARTEHIADRGRHRRNGSHECLETVAVSVDLRYEGTRDHSRRVANLAVMLGHELGLDPAQLGALEKAALLHDIGMIAVPEVVLLHPGPLSARQWNAIREHPALGESIIAAGNLGNVGRIVRSHHERWDGTGYPDGLRGQSAPLESRILAVCEAFDAMTSERTYRGPYSVAGALQQVDLGISTQFDPIVAEAFIRMVSRDDLLGPTEEALGNLFRP